jgi:general secretion pathway protein D
MSKLFGLCMAIVKKTPGAGSGRRRSRPARALSARFRECLALVLCLAVGPVLAAPVSFSFNAVPLVDFAQFTYRDLLKRDYVLSAELVGLNKKISINVKSLDDSKLVAFVDGVLRSQGVRAVDRDGVFFLEAAPVGLVENSPALVSPGAGASPLVAPGLAGGPGGSLAASGPVLPEFRVIDALNRPVEFLVAAVNAVAGFPVARPAGGKRLALAGSKADLKVLAALVKQLDVAADVVEVSASFVEVTTNEASAVGGGLSLVAAAVGRQSGLAVTPDQGVLSLRAGSYELVMQALAADGRFKQVSNSRVVGDDAEKLLLSVGDEVPTIGGVTLDQQGHQIQNVVYRPSGVILDVLPRVLGSGRLSLLVDGQVSTFQATTTGVSNSPTLVKRQVKTSVSVGDGEVLVIGGLNDSKATQSTAGFSFLPASWRTKSGRDQKTDLVLILSARVLAKK